VSRHYEAWLALPEHVRTEQSLLAWPASFADGRLPWEAAQAALDLLRHRDGRGLPRPSTRQAKWFWRLRLASPDLPVEDASTAAASLAGAEYLKLAGFAAQEPTGLEWWLSAAPWTSAEAQAHYDAACQREPDRVVDFTFRVTGTADEINAASARLRSQSMAAQGIGNT